MENNKENVVYAYIFEDTKVAYIGRTVNIKHRNYVHRTDIKKDTSRKYVYNSKVYEYANEHNIEIPEIIILERKLDLKESLIKEEYWMTYYASHGYQLLNKNPSGIFSGAVGTLSEERYTDENLVEFGKLFESLTEFKIKMPNTYKTLKSKGVLEKLNLHLFPDISNNNDDTSSVRNFTELAQRMNNLFNLVKS